MYDFSIGVMLESFKLPIPEAIKKAKELGAEGIQVYATYGELSPTIWSVQSEKNF